MNIAITRWLGSLVLLGAMLGTAQASTTDWNAQLAISTATTQPQTLTIGTSATGVDNYFGGEDAAAPPSLPSDNGSVASLGVAHTAAEGFPLPFALYVTDIRAPVPGGQSKTWQPINAFTAMNTDNGDTVTIHWTLNGVPDNIQLHFEELGAGTFNPSDTNGDGVTSYDMKQVQTYTYHHLVNNGNQTSQFRVVATNTAPSVNLVGTVAQSNLTSNGVTLAFATDVPANAQVEVTPTAGGTSKTFSAADFTTQHTLVATGLDPNTAYTAKITATAQDSTIQPLVVPNITFTTSQTTIAITDINVTVGVTDATVTWKTDVAASSTVAYGTTAAYGQAATDAQLVQSHSLKITNLSPSTTYHFQVTSAIPNQGQASSGDRTFTTQGPTITITAGPTATNVTATGATITWTTDVASDSKVDYGKTTTYDLSASSADLVTTHSVTLQGLQSNTPYHFRVTSTAAGRPAVVSADATFTTPNGIVTLVGTPSIRRTGSSATISFDTNVQTSATIKYGEGAALNLSQNDTAATPHHVITLSGLKPSTNYSLQIVASATGFDTLTSQTFTLTTLGANVNYAFVDAYSVLDTANDPTGQIVNQTSPLFGATTGAERDVAYDSSRGILYIARGTLVTEDGRPNGQFGVAAIQLVPPSKSFNPNAPEDISNYTDTGLITAPSDNSGAPTLGFVQSIAYDPISDALYVFSGSPAGGPSKTPTVFRAPGGTLGGASTGGNPSSANPALTPLFTVNEPNDSAGSPLGGNNRGIAVRTVNGFTTVYLAMAQHADVWSNTGGSGQWARVWSSNLFPADSNPDQPLNLTDTAVRSVTVDEDGNSYWTVSSATTSPRIWVFPASTSGAGIGFNDAAFNGAHTGVGRPLVIDNDGTVIPPSGFIFPDNVEYVRDGGTRTLFVSVLGADGHTPSIARLRVTSDPNSAGNQVTARLVDGFGAGATGAAQDSILKSLTVKGAAGQTQPSEPPAAAKLLYFTVSPEENTLYINGFVRNDKAGQTIPTSAVEKVTYGPPTPRPFLTKLPHATVQGTTVTITWSTDVATTDNRVEYGTDTTYGQVATETTPDGGSQDHSVVISNLLASTTYHFHVVSSGANLQPVISTDDTFTTGIGVMLGDINGDKKINVQDATLSLQLAVGLIQPTPAQFQAGDVNKDGKLNTQDTTKILQVAVGLANF